MEPHHARTENKAVLLFIKKFVAFKAFEMHLFVLQISTIRVYNRLQIQMD